MMHWQNEKQYGSAKCEMAIQEDGTKLVTEQNLNQILFFSAGVESEVIINTETPTLVPTEQENFEWASFPLGHSTTNDKKKTEVSW